MDKSNLLGLGALRSRHQHGLKCGKNLLDRTPEVIGKEPGKIGRVLNSPCPSESECQTEGKQVGWSQPHHGTETC